MAPLLAHTPELGSHPLPPPESEEGADGPPRPLPLAPRPTRVAAATQAPAPPESGPEPPPAPRLARATGALEPPQPPGSPASQTAGSVPTATLYPTLVQNLTRASEARGDGRGPGHREEGAPAPRPAEPRPVQDAAAPEPRPVESAPRPALATGPVPIPREAPPAPASHAPAAGPQGLPAHPAAPGAPSPVQSPSVAPPAVAAQHPAIAQVEGSIRWILKQGSQSAELQLHPENLGKVTIQLKVEGTQVHARVWASEAATLPVLNDHRASLEVSLRQQGLSLGSFDLQQGQRGPQQQSHAPLPQGWRPAQEPASPVIRQDAPTVLASPFANTHRIEVLA